MATRRNIGRNEPCPCGSGRKYKKCHGANIHDHVIHNPLDDPDVKRKLQEMRAAEMQRLRQQGRGRPIISCLFKGYRFVAVGERYYYSKGWVTFHDFLFDYVKSIFGRDWGAAELKKTLIDRHPILQWSELISKEQVKTSKERGVVHLAPMSGAAFAYLSLSYNLYLLAHNIRLQSLLVERLKDKNGFLGAFYETIVASYFIKAGFGLEPEREDDFSRTHCEFSATSGKTGRRYSVEAKTRILGKPGFSVRNQLHKALCKEADHARVVFIDLNVPHNVDPAIKQLTWLNDILADLRSCESTLTVHHKPAPEAYIVVTNHPFLYNLDSCEFTPAAVVEGFKIPDLKVDSQFSDLRDALQSREKHIDILDLMSAMREHDQIPSTWDGEIPEYAFGKISEPRLKMGNRYVILDDSGREVIGELEDAVVLQRERKIWGTYRLENGRQIIVRSEISEPELRVFRQYPDLFFGVHRDNYRKARDPLELYDFFYETYKNCTKERLLELVQGHPDFQSLQEKCQEELARICCERLVYSALPMREGPKLMPTDPTGPV